jgi:hypothetical protein
MAVVTVKIFQVTNRDQAIRQADVDTVSGSANTFLAGLDPANVLDVKGEYFPVGKYGSSAFSITVIYLQ